MLISNANFITESDHLSAAWDIGLTSLGTVSGSAIADTVRYAIAAYSSLITTLGDIEQETDLLQGAASVNASANTQFMIGTLLSAPLNAMQNHCRQRGYEVASSIVDVPSFLNYYNGGAGAGAFTNMVTPSYAAAWKQIFGTNLPAAGVMSPAITAVNPIVTNLGATVSSIGMGSNSIGGSFSAGASVNSLYSAVNPVLVVTSNFSGNTSGSVISVSGVDNTGATTIWTATLPINVAASLVGLTLGGAVTAEARQTVNVTTNTAISAGSVLTIDGTTANAETVFVESATSGTITAVFMKPHGFGASITGNYAQALTPSVAGRRLTSISGITITANGATAGAVRVDGIQDRIGV